MILYFDEFEVIRLNAGPSKHPIFDAKVLLLAWESPTCSFKAGHAKPALRDEPSGHVLYQDRIIAFTRSGFIPVVDC